MRGGLGASAFYTDQGVVFEYKAPGEITRIDDAEVRHQYPEDEFPTLYGARSIDTKAVRKAFPPKTHRDLYTVSIREERVDVKV